MFKIVGYSKRKGSNKKNLPNGFKEDDFLNKIPIIYLEGIMDDIRLEKIKLICKESNNSFLINASFLFVNKKGIDFKISKKKEIIVSGYFSIEHNSSTSITKIRPVEDFEELKKSPIFFSNEITEILRLREFRKKLVWYKQKDRYSYKVSKIFSIESIQPYKSMIMQGEYVNFYDENLVLGTAYINSSEELIKNSEPYNFKEE